MMRKRCIILNRRYRYRRRRRNAQTSETCTETQNTHTQQEEEEEKEQLSTHINGRVAIMRMCESQKSIFQSSTNRLEAAKLPVFLLPNNPSFRLRCGSPG